MAPKLVAALSIREGIDSMLVRHDRLHLQRNEQDYAPITSDIDAFLRQ